MLKTILNIDVPVFTKAENRTDWLKSNNAKNLEILKSFTFPKEFVQQQNQLFHNFYKELSSNDFFYNLNNNKTTEVINSLIRAFVIAYKLADYPTVRYYTHDDFVENYEHKQKIKCQYIPIMYKEDNTVNIMNNAIENLGNKKFVEGIFHECLHIYQSQGNFEQYPEVEKGFKKLNQLAIDKSLYYYLPVERHSYSIQYLFIQKLNKEHKFVNRTEMQKNKTENVYKIEENLWHYIYGHSFSQALGVPLHKVKLWETETIPNMIAELQKLSKSNESNIDFLYDKIFLKSSVNYDRKARCIYFSTNQPEDLNLMFGPENIIKLGNNKYKTKAITNRQEFHLKNAYARYVAKKSQYKKY